MTNQNQDQAVISPADLSSAQEPETDALSQEADIHASDSAGIETPSEDAIPLHAPAHPRHNHASGIILFLESLIRQAEAAFPSEFAEEIETLHGVAIRMKFKMKTPE